MKLTRNQVMQLAVDLCVDPSVSFGELTTVLARYGIEVEEPKVTGNSLEKQKISIDRFDKLVEVVSLNLDMQARLTASPRSVLCAAFEEAGIEVERPRTPEQRIKDFVEALRGHNWCDRPAVLQDLVRVHLAVEI